MGGSGDWGMPRSSASPVGSAGHPSMMRPGMEYSNSKGMMSGPMVSRSNSVSGARSMLQQQLMEIGTSVNLLPEKLSQTQQCEEMHKNKQYQHANIELTMAHVRKVCRFPRSQCQCNFLTIVTLLALNTKYS